MDRPHAVGGHRRSADERVKEDKPNVTSFRSFDVTGSFLLPERSGVFSGAYVHGVVAGNPLPPGHPWEPPPLLPALQETSPPAEEASNLYSPRERFDAEELGGCESAADWATASMGLGHPLRAEQPLDDDLREVVRRLKGTTARETAQCRKRVLQWIGTVRDSLPPAPQRGGLPLPNAPLFRVLLEECGYNDASAAELCIGAPILGRMGGPLEWPAESRPQVVAQRPEIIARSASERSPFLATVKPGRFDQTLWDESMSDVRKERMRGPFRSLQAVEHSLGTKDYVISRRFGVEQTDKLRPCDDFTASFVNEGILVERKLKLSNLDNFFALAYAMYGDVTPDAAGGRRRRASGLRFWRRDHEGAYRQIPIPVEDQPLTVVVFCDPATGEHVYFYHTALPFGATASVYGYNRVARAVVFLARKLLDIPVDSYFDDFWGVDSAEGVWNGFHAFGELNELLGFAIKKKKDVPPTDEGVLLGIAIQIAKLPFVASLMEERRMQLVTSIRWAITANRLTPAEAATLAGRMNFAETGIFGRVGRVPLRAVYARQHAERDAQNLSYRVTRLLGAALQALLALLERPPPRSIPHPASPRPVATLYTDGEGKGYIGAVLLLRENGGSATVFSSRVTRDTFKMLKHRVNQIALIELLAVLAALEAFKDLITGCDLRIFIDNVVAEGAIRNGYMRRDCRDACALVAALWQQFLELDLLVWVDRVPSELNVADGPSRPYNPSLLGPLYSLNLPVNWRENVTIPHWAVEALRASLAPRSSGV